MGTEPPRRTDTRQALIDAASGGLPAARVRARDHEGDRPDRRRGRGDHLPALRRQVRALPRGVPVAHGRGRGRAPRFRERAGQGTVRDNLETLFALVGGIQEQLSSLMASMWADPELARNIGARARELAPEGFVPPGPVAMVAEYIRRSRSWAGSGATSTRQRPRRSWSRCRSRPGWSARSARIPPRPASSPCRMTSRCPRPVPSTSWRAGWLRTRR